MPSIARVVLCLVFFLPLVTGCGTSLPTWEKLRQINSDKDLEIIDERTPPLPQKLCLEEIIAIALEKNLDLEIKRKEFSVQCHNTMREQLRMLPQLIAHQELSIRNNDLIVASKSVDPLVPPAPPSISTNRGVNRRDIVGTLNILDFGLAYFKARQEGHRSYISAIEYYRAEQSIIMEICQQFWRAVAAKAAIDGSQDVLLEAEIFQEKIRKQMDERFVSRNSALKNISDLITLQIRFDEDRREYFDAMMKLNQLMGRPYHCDFELCYDLSRPTALDLEDIIVLEDVALTHRLELYTRDAEEQVAADEVRYALWQMIPGVEAFVGSYFDSNTFLTYNHWIVAGAQATWNLLRLPSFYFDKLSAERRRDVARANRLALSVAVLSQVRLAYILYNESYRQYENSKLLEDTNDELLGSIEGQYLGGAVSAGEVLQTKAQTLTAKINALKAYGNMQIDLEKLNQAMGTPRYYKNS